MVFLFVIWRQPCGATSIFDGFIFYQILTPNDDGGDDNADHYQAGEVEHEVLRELWDGSHEIFKRCLWSHCLLWSGNHHHISICTIWNYVIIIVTIVAIVVTLIMILFKEILNALGLFEMFGVGLQNGQSYLYNVEYF